MHNWQYSLVGVVLLLAVVLAARWIWRQLHPSKGQEMRCAGCLFADNCDKKKDAATKKCDKNVAQSRK